MKNRRRKKQQLTKRYCRMNRRKQDEKDEEEESDNVRSTKRPIGATTSNLTKRQKREKEDCLLQKAVQCMEAATSNNSTDADKIFGDYIASELRAIEDQKAKRFLKHQIQSLIFSASNDYPGGTVRVIMRAMRNRVVLRVIAL